MGGGESKSGGTTTVAIHNDVKHNVTVKNFADSQQIGLSEKPTKAEVFKKICDKNTSMIMKYRFDDTTGTIQENNFGEKDMGWCNKLIHDLQTGLTDPLGDDCPNPIKIMEDNRAKFENKWKEAGKNLTQTSASKTEAQVTVKTYSLESVKAVAESLVTSLVSGMDMEEPLARALVIPKVCDFLSKLPKDFEKLDAAATFELKEFSFVLPKLHDGVLSVKPIRIQFSSSKEVQRGYFMNSSSSFLYINIESAIFTATKDVDLTADF